MCLRKEISSWDLFPNAAIFVVCEPLKPPPRLLVPEKIGSEYFSRGCVVFIILVWYGRFMSHFLVSAQLLRALVPDDLLGKSRGRWCLPLSPPNAYLHIYRIYTRFSIPTARLNFHRSGLDRRASPGRGLSYHPSVLLRGTIVNRTECCE